MKSIIIIQDTSLEAFHEQTMAYLQAKYHTYPYVFERVPGAEDEVEMLASMDLLCADDVPAANGVPVGKLVL